MLFSEGKVWDKVFIDWPSVCACAFVKHVFTGNNVDIRRTEGLIFFVFVLVLMSRLSSLAHKYI